MTRFDVRVFGSEWFAHILEIGALLVLTSLVLGIVRHSLGNGWIRYALGRRDTLGLVSGALLGAVTPVCSCSVGAIYASLVHHGASHRSAAAFLFAAPAVNEVVLVTVVVAFGWKGGLAYMVAGITAAIVTGRFAERLRLQPCAHCTGAFLPAPGLRRSAWRLALADTHALVRAMALPVFIGAGLAGVLQAWHFDPATVLARVGEAPWAPVAAALIGLPLHVEPGLVAGLVVPLAASGLAMGTLISFTMATTVASLPEGAVLRTLVGWRGIGALSAWFFAYTAGIGLLINHVWIYL